MFFQAGYNAIGNDNGMPSTSDKVCAVAGNGGGGGMAMFWIRRSNNLANQPAVIKIGVGGQPVTRANGGDGGQTSFSINLYDESAPLRLLARAEGGQGGLEEQRFAYVTSTGKNNHIMVPGAAGGLSNYVGEVNDSVLWEKSLQGNPGSDVFLHTNTNHVLFQRGRGGAPGGESAAQYDMTEVEENDFYEYIEVTRGAEETDIGCTDSSLGYQYMLREGTIVTTGTSVLTGVDTSFTTNLSIGDTVATVFNISNVDYEDFFTIQSIESDTSLTLSSVHPRGTSGSPVTDGGIYKKVIVDPTGYKSPANSGMGGSGAFVLYRSEFEGASLGNAGSNGYVYIIEYS